MDTRNIPNLIGLSLSSCIRDVVEGKVSVEQIDRIIANTCCLTAADWDHVISVYRDAFWQADPDRAERIVRTLLELGKIDQPRTRDEDPPSRTHHYTCCWRAA